MPEYVDRDAAIAKIEERAMLRLHMHDTLSYQQMKLVKWDIDDIPAADVRPVVYCKDCVHFIRGELFGDMVCDYHYLHHYHAEPNEFCSHAEKREES